MTRPPVHEPLPLGAGRYVVPANRADLLADRRPLTPPVVSVVIPYYRQQDRLDLVLTALAVQTHPRDRLEVVVADDGSPRPPDLGALGPEIASRVVRQADEGFRAAAARNLGARAAGGSVLCFLDGDTVPEPDYVRAASRLPALVPDALVTGRRRHADLTGLPPRAVQRWLSTGQDPPPEIPAPRWLADLHESSRDLAELDRHSYRAVISAVLSCSADLFTELGGFDESFTAYGGEDWELGYRALNAGAVLAHEPAAVAWHDGVDWGARLAADQARAAAQKEVETTMLARLIPGLETLGVGPPDVLITVAAPAEVTVAAAATYRADPGLDCAVGCSAEGARARVWIHLVGDTELPGAEVLRRLVARVGPGLVGRSTLRDPAGWQATAYAAPALRRAERWAGRLPSDDLLADLFGAECRDAGLR